MPQGMWLLAQSESAAAMAQAKQLIPELSALEGLELVVPMERCSNIFSFRVTEVSAATEEGRERFTKSLQAANVQVSTGAPAHGAPPASAAAGCQSYHGI